MWHLQTKLGTFWILDAEEGKDNEFVLGIDNDILGTYTDLLTAVSDVQRQETGCLRWDVAHIARAAPPLEGWKEGEPGTWD